MLARPHSPPDPRVLSLCAKFGIEIVPSNVFPYPGSTRAVGTISRLIDHYGEGHVRLVMHILSKGRRNHALINQTSLVAVSGLLRACPDIVEHNMSGLLDSLDRVPYGPLMDVVSELSGEIHQAHALAALLYMHVRGLREEPLTVKDARYLVMHRARASEAAKGRAMR